MNVDLKAVIESKNPYIFRFMPDVVSRLIIRVLERIICTKQIYKFCQTHTHQKNVEFIDSLFDDVDFSCHFSKRDTRKIPAEGRLICVANHPLGSLDGLGLLKIIATVRKDVKIVVNDLLLHIENLRDLFLPYDIYSSRLQTAHIRQIRNALFAEEAIIFFPAAQVSRFTLTGITDSTWRNGPVYFAQKYNAPVLPIYAKAKNSWLFYLLSWLFPNLGTFLLPYELFRKKPKSMTAHFGDLIPSKTFSSKIIDSSTYTHLLRKSVYQLGKQAQEFSVPKRPRPIIAPVDKQTLACEFSNSQLLLTVNETTHVMLVDYESSEHIIEEIARLRELTFRKVGEGTEQHRDTDCYDCYYKHLVLYDHKQREIIGAYRLGFCQEILKNRGKDALYSASLFELSEKFTNNLQYALELGRSFIQEAYWKSYALNYLWKGIGILLSCDPNLKYLFGTVSLSNRYSEDAKCLIISFYTKWFSGDSKLAQAKRLYRISRKQNAHISNIFKGTTIQEDYITLKQVLKIYGFTVPVLFKAYTSICEPGGAIFLDFGRDLKFSNCIDGLLFMYLDTIKPKYRLRYLPSDNQFKKGEHTLCTT